MALVTREGGIRVDPTLTIVSIIQILVMAASVTAWALTKGATTEETGRRLTEFQASLQAQITALQGDTKVQLGTLQADTARRFDDVLHQIAGLPDTTARLNQVEARLTRVEAQTAAIEAHVVAVERMAVQASADINTLGRATNAPLRAPR